MSGVLHQRSTPTRHSVLGEVPISLLSGISFRPSHMIFSRTAGLKDEPSNPLSSWRRLCGSNTLERGKNLAIEVPYFLDLVSMTCRLNFPAIPSNRLVIRRDLKCYTISQRFRRFTLSECSHDHHFPLVPRLISSRGYRGGHYLNSVSADSSFQRQSLLAPFAVEIYPSRDEGRKGKTERPGGVGNRSNGPFRDGNRETRFDDEKEEPAATVSSCWKRGSRGFSFNPP